MVEAVLQSCAVGCHRTDLQARVVVVHLDRDDLAVDDLGHIPSALRLRGTATVGHAAAGIVVLGHVVAAFCSTGAEADSRGARVWGTGAGRMVCRLAGAGGDATSARERPAGPCGLRRRTPWVHGCSRRRCPAGRVSLDRGCTLHLLT